MRLPAEPLLTVKNLQVFINGKHILQDIDFSVFDQELLSIVGPNGAGKTTLLKAILGLIPYQGHIRRRPGVRISYLPQRLVIDSTLPLQIIDLLQLFSDQPRKKIQSEYKKILAEVGLASLPLTQNIHTLSGGQWQRLLLAQALLRKPVLLLLDEPAQGLDVMGQGELYNLLEQLREQEKLAIVMVSHDLSLVMAKSDQVLCLQKHLCCFGKPEGIEQHPEFLRIFPDLPRSIGLYPHQHGHRHAVDGSIISSTPPEKR
jgi:zinc transport system ATP-binding protein